MEGALHSNGEVGRDSIAGGGAGGAILIFVNHLDGEGTIETRGGGLLFFHVKKRAVTCDFQQCVFLTCVDSDQPVQPPFKLRNSK